MSDDKFTTNPSNNSGQDNSQPIDDQELQDDSVQPEVVEEMSTKPAEENIDYKDKWLRAQADYSNLVKETASRRSEWVAMSEAQILEDFLPVYENLGKALSTDLTNTDSTDFGKQVENWKKGVGFIQQQFWTVLKNHNIEKIETVGKQFDPNKHEAVGEEKVEGKADHEIVREVDGGYMMNGKVIKVAKVIVNSK